MPNTLPILFMVATDVLLLLHVPPGVASLSIPELLIQIAVFPVIAAGRAFTVTVVVV